MHVGKGCCTCYVNSRKGKDFLYLRLPFSNEPERKGEPFRVPCFFPEGPCLAILAMISLAISLPHF